jgi:F-type H+-transporting ATPase subunit gamma
MGAQQRVFRRRIKSVQATKKITKAMELIASSRIVKAQQRVEAALPYSRELIRAISAATTHSQGEHPLTTTEQRQRTRAAVLIVTSDRGLAGGYSSNALREGEQLTQLLREQGVEVLPYLVGRKAVNYYRFRDRKIEQEWIGFSEEPSYANAKEVADTLLDRFMLRSEEGGVDEIHVVYTHFENMVVQRPTVRRILPLEVVEQTAEEAAAAGQGPFPLYDFEPSPGAVLDSLLPKYVENLVYTALLLSSASELAARRRACKAATDNANDLIKTLSRQANQARQAEITQEISEIVGGADALSSAS